MSKFRKDFVTNSSSSSFICDVSGGVQTGYDMGLSEAGMIECENGHIFYEYYALDIPTDDMREMLKENLLDRIKNDEEHIQKYGDNDRYYGEGYYGERIAEYKETLQRLENGDLDSGDIEEMVYDNCEIRYCLPEKYCPICSMKYIKDKDTLDFILDELSLTKEEIHEKMRLVKKIIKK